MLMHYLDLAWRSLRKTPLMSLLMVFAISIGIGITIMTLNVHQVMSANPSAERSDKLLSVQLWSQGQDTWRDYSAILTYQDVINLRRGTVPVRQAAMFRTGKAVTTDNPNIEAEMQSIRITDSDFFAMFSVPFLYGNVWDKAVDEVPEHVVVIGKELNDKLFDGRNSVGETLYLNTKPYRIVGVTDRWSPKPRYYDLTTGSMNDAELLFVPFSLTPIEEFEVWGNTNGWKFEPLRTFQDRMASEKAWLQFWAEVDSPEQKKAFQDYLNAHVDSQQQLGRFTDKSRDSWARTMNVAELLDFHEVVPEDNKILIGLSLLFLLVCLVNILGLMLTKFLKRAPEVGVRRAIGASKRQIFAQHLVEVGCIGAIGGALGLLWAWAALQYLAKKFFLEEAMTNLDPSIWVIAPAIAIVSAMLAGMYPAWVICKTKPSVYLKSQ
ncbi:ABC transporter permease [Shewanella sedimentimangrovi]|uniref:ABC transporter permease n=1 Tax=Shewanella sedimentimangrovi TaxID=2814293 RepID=A0ABX7QY40_9GAMM|nr:ABC transporter permease [Shewanella sedimentimangrovi]QSX36447.1 ABC transporter permease [Shewanella sedimentimangrovi]